MREEWIEPTEGERERLYILVEELNEAQHLVTKILRFGYREVYPETRTTNRTRLQEELGDVLAMVEIMVREGDLDALEIEAAREAKKQKLRSFTRGGWGRRG
jgi:NTP pyrophosphatase (non-canonical NTP hydrolase)